MNKIRILALCLIILVLYGCQVGGVNYSKSLFQHIPDDPELLVLVNPNDISRLVELAVSEINLSEFIGNNIDVDAKMIDHYKNVAVEMLDALGVPWDKVESVGFLIYYQKPVFLVSGNFTQAAITAKLKELGFRQHDNGFFDYVYGEQKLSVPSDGLMMMAEEVLLDDLQMVPDENRLWNRADFAAYRSTSPLNNSLFIWTHPPEHFLRDFQFRDQLGDISLAMNFRSSFSFKSTIRVNDPEKAVYLHDFLLGLVYVGKGLFGSDEAYGPLFSGLKVHQDNRVVEASLALSMGQLMTLKDRVQNDFKNGDTSTFRKIDEFLKKF
jgi:hypothetical protein